MNPSAHTKASLVLFLILAASHACLAQAPSAAPCKSKPECRQFDFWVGEWDVQNPQGQPAGTSSVRLILGDCVIFENEGQRGQELQRLSRGDRQMATDVGGQLRQPSRTTRRLQRQSDAP